MLNNRFCLYTVKLFKSKQLNSILAKYTYNLSYYVVY